MYHEFQPILEGFRSSDETDMIGSKVISKSPPFVPYKYSSSIENCRYFSNYAEKFGMFKYPLLLSYLSLSLSPSLPPSHSLWDGYDWEVIINLPTYILPQLILRYFSDYAENFRMFQKTQISLYSSSPLPSLHSPTSPLRWEVPLLSMLKFLQIFPPILD